MQLKRTCVPAEDLVAYYCPCIRSSLGYTCPVFHYSLPQYLQSELESVQKRALACIFPRMPYGEALERACLTSIREHHEDITKSLFRSISENQDSKLHHLIPEAYSPHYNFRHRRTYNVPAVKTKRFANSFFVKCAAVTNSSWDEWEPFNRTLSQYIYICICVVCKWLRNSVFYCDVIE